MYLLGKRSLHNTKLLILLRASSFNFNSTKCQFCKKNLEFPKLAKAWPLSVWQHGGFGCIVFAPLPTRPLLVSATLRDSGDLAQVGTCDVERRSQPACSAPDKELRCWCSHDEPATARGGTRGWMREREGRGGPLPPWHGASYTLHLPSAPSHRPHFMNRPPPGRDLLVRGGGGRPAVAAAATRASDTHCIQCTICSHAEISVLAGNLCLVSCKGSRGNW